MNKRWLLAGQSPWVLIVTIFLLALEPGIVRAAGAERGSGEPPAFQATKGRITFRSYCVNCHGDRANGHGHVAQYLNVEPADLTKLQASNGGVFPEETVTESIDGRRYVKGHGTRDMPIWGEIFQSPLVKVPGTATGEERVACKICELVYFLETMQAPVAGESQPAAEEAPAYTSGGSSE